MKNTTRARPFLKWAGGKGQLLDQFERLFPPELKEGGIAIYAEPFLGGGAVFFHVIANYAIKGCLLSDINRDIIAVYRTIKNSHTRLVANLTGLAQNYLPLDGEGRKRFFLRVRDEFNARRGPRDAVRAAQLLFLNRTCYNGLFRMNSRGEFNAPHGSYKNPRIIDPANLEAVSRTLKKANLSVMDFEKLPGMLAPTNQRAFVYLDPPYQPLSRTSHFTAYSKSGFGPEEQERLAGTFRKLDLSGAKVMLSNSDGSDGFIRGLYRGFHVHSVNARRSINSRGDRRGFLKELVITNY